MKLSSTKPTKKILGSSTFSIGDLVCYAPYFNDDSGWVMRGDLGIVVNVMDIVDESYQILTINWIAEGIDNSDMASDVVEKISLDKVEK